MLRGYIAMRRSNRYANCERRGGQLFQNNRACKLSGNEQNTFTPERRGAYSNLHLAPALQGYYPYRYYLRCCGKQVLFFACVPGPAILKIQCISDYNYFCIN
jgi:hypothetical protein